MDRTSAQRVRGIAHRAKSVERTGQCELRRPEAIDEVAAPDPTGILHGPQDWVDGAEAAVNAVGGDGLAGHHPVALEQGKAEGVEALGGRDRRGRAGLRGDERPASGGLGRPERGEPARPEPAT